MYRKNTAGQYIGFAAINASTGAAMSGTTGFAAFRVLDGSAQAAATGSVTDKTNGQYSFAFSQADTNGNNGSILFTMPGMVPVEKTFVTTACDPTNAANFGITDIDTNIASRSTYAGGAVASVTAPVTVGTNSDKGGYSLAAAGLDSVKGWGTWSARQTIQAIAQFLFGLRSGVPAAGSPGTVTYTGPSSFAYGTVTVDTAGDITVNSLSPPT